MRRRIGFELKRTQLDRRKRRADGDLFVDYGWIRLLYTGDGDEQEIAYHLNQKRCTKRTGIFENLLAPGQTAIDVGANLGFVTTMLLQSLVREAAWCRSSRHAWSSRSFKRRSQQTA